MGYDQLICSTYPKQHKFQKQCKQLILTDSRNILTPSLQQMQRKTPSFMTDSTRNFRYTMHNGDNTKLRIFSFISQIQRIQPNFMTYAIRTFAFT